MLLRVVLVSSAVVLAAAGCGHRARTPAAAAPEAPPTRWRSRRAAAFLRHHLLGERISEP